MRFNTYVQTQTHIKRYIYMTAAVDYANVKLP